MANEEKNADKELYQELRRWPVSRIWQEEAPRFNQASAKERGEKAALVRAIGVVFSESGSPEQKNAARQWMRGLLADPNEKLRRYAIAALPKLGATGEDEAALLALFRSTTLDREKKFLTQALGKIGGAATLQTLERAADTAFRQTEQKVKANVARATAPSSIQMNAALPDINGLRLHLRGRAGLESFVREEVEKEAAGIFRVIEVQKGLAAVAPVRPFSLAELFRLRCFGSAGFVLGTMGAASSNGFDSATLDAIAAAIVSPLAQRLFKTLTEGPPRYRLDFVAQGHQRAAVRHVASRAYTLRPDILNSASESPWTVAIHPAETGHYVELVPKISPDPRLSYRRKDVPAASHPPLAACMARLAGVAENEAVWDPFCGSGLELVECALRGASRLYGSDRSPEAIQIAQANFTAAGIKAAAARFFCCDFRDFAARSGLGPNSLSLVLTNPPLGKRVPIPNLRGLLLDLCRVSATLLRPGGRLVFANPLKLENPHPALKLEFRQPVDFGGFDCLLEKYVKVS